MAKVKRHVLVSVVHGVQLLSIQELLHVVLDDWVLGNRSLLGSGCIEANHVSESENVFEFLALESVLVNIDRSISVSNS